MIRKDIEEYNLNFFKEVGKNMALVTAGGKEGFNPMTVSWGEIGILWNRPVATLFIRASRETLKYVEAHDNLTLSFFGGAYKENLILAGKISGRDYKDKFNEINLTPVYDVDADVYYAKEARYVFKLTKIYMTDIKEEDILDKKIVSDFYGDNDYHKMIICKINQFLVNEE